MRKIIFLIIILTSCFSWGQVLFSDKATELGIELSYGSGTYGGGVSFCDYNKDGWDDLTLSSEDGQPIRFFKNVSGTYVEEYFTISDNNIETKQVQWVDFDNDGDKDLFTTSKLGVNRLLQNDGNFNFTDISTSSGLTNVTSETWGSSWGDYNNDGFLDVFICFLKFGNTQPNALFKNNGNSTFTNVSVSAGINQIKDPSFCSAFFDFNNDNLQDIFVTNHKYDQSYLYKNNGDGTFTDISVPSGANIYADGMSTTIGDYNNDGWLDFYVTNSAAGNFLMRNNGNETFTNIANVTGTIFSTVSWGAVFLDADNDSHMDLYVSGQNDGTDNLLPSAFYYNNGNNAFTIPTNIGLQDDTRRSFSNAIGDVDNDGFPEIFVVNENENNFLWKNKTSNNNNWIKINLTGVTSNKDGIGSKIEINAGGSSQYRYTLNGEGYIGQNSNSEFVGLGTATTIDYIKVTWLSGTVDTFNNISPNQTLNITEGQALSVNEYDLETVQLYPNPVTDILNIRLDNISTTNFKVELYNLLGKKVLSENKEGLTAIVDLSNYATGIYLLKCTIDDEVITKKVVVK